MNQFLYKKTNNFSTRKVSIDQTIKLLGRNGICVNKEKAEKILNFLYLIAKTYKIQKLYDENQESKHKE